MKKGILQNLYTINDNYIPLIRFKSYEKKWENSEIGKLVRIKSGNSPSLFKLTKNGYPFIKVDDLNNSIKNQNYSKLYVEPNNSMHLINKDSIIFPKRGAAILTNKTRYLMMPSYMDTNMMALEPLYINSEFLYYFIHRTGLYKIADTSTIPQINNKHIEPYKIFIPETKEQEQIGNLLKKVDEDILKVEMTLEKYKDMKKGFLQKLFPKGE